MQELNLAYVSSKDLAIDIQHEAIETLKPISTVAIFMYACLATAHWVLLPFDVRAPMTIAATVSAVVVLFIRLRLYFGRIEKSHAIGWCVFIVAVATINSLLHIAVSGQLEHSTNLALIMVVTGYVFLMLRWLVVTIALQLVGWGLVVIWHSLSENLLHYAFMLFISSFLSVLLNRARAISVRNARQARVGEDRFRAAFESSGVGNFVLDSEGRILLSNRTAEEMFGFPSGGSPGLPVKKLLKDRSDRHNSGRQDSGEYYEMSGIRREGDEFPIRLSVSSMGDSNSESIMNVVDLSELRKLQDELDHRRRLEAIGQLTGGIAHDLNNILQVIVCETESIRLRHCLDGDINDALKNVIVASDRAKTLIQRLLEFSRRQPAPQETVELNAVVGDMLQLIRRTLGETIEVRFQPSQQPEYVAVNSGKLEQVVMNLCINARDAMPEGGTLDVSISRCPEDRASLRDMVVMTVRDSGCGMDQETKERLFEPYYTSKEFGAGNGIGLSVVHGIVEQLEGSIKVESEIGVGTSFRLKLPLSAPIPKKKAPQIVPRPRGNEVILVAEDNRLVLNGLTKTLTNSGYQVIGTENGSDAIVEFMRHQDTIDLLLFDVVMPSLSGPATYTRIQSVAENKPVIFMTGFDSGKLSRDLLSQPYCKIIEKPFTNRQLLSMVRDTLSETYV